MMVMMDAPGFHKVEVRANDFAVRNSRHPTHIVVQLFGFLMFAATLLGCQQPLVVQPLYSAIGETIDAQPERAALAPATATAVTVTETWVTLPTYPFERYQTDAFDDYYRWPYKRFDVERYRAEAPTPTRRAYRLVVLENEWLRLLLLPELGGRLWQVIHKPTGAPMFYQNEYVKPTHWGHPNQLGWLALGGLEWGLPVIEHGYDWGTPWPYMTERNDAGEAAVVVTTPDDGRLLHARIRVSLRPGEASFFIEPQLTNRSTRTLAYSFWLDAMLAPGSGGRPSAQLQFVLPTARVRLHSTAEPGLPSPGETFPWPRVGARDLSRLGAWGEYLGFFESPAAHGPFVGVYDPAFDAGAVRIFPPDVAQGSKVFALGWRNALASDNYTADDSVYVELHGGVAPSFFEQARLTAGDAIAWQEQWYPVHGIGGLVYSNEQAALNLTRTAGGLRVGLYSPRPLTGLLVVGDGAAELARVAVQATPNAPFTALVNVGARPSGPLTLRLEDADGRTMFTYRNAADEP